MQIQFEPGRVDSNFTDTFVRLHYDPAQGFGVGFYGERADTLFAQWLVGYLKASVWEALNAAHRQHPEWNRSDMEDFRKAMAAHKGSLAGDQVGFAKPIESGRGRTVA